MLLISSLTIFSPYTHHYLFYPYELCLTHTVISNIVFVIVHSAHTSQMTIFFNSYFTVMNFPPSDGSVFMFN